MDVTVATSTKRNQIFICVITQSASRANVVHLKIIGTSARLASPTITLQHFDSEFAIRIRAQPKPRSPQSKISH
jgi:hypothetical protein